MVKIINHLKCARIYFERVDDYIKGTNENGSGCKKCYCEHIVLLRFYIAVCVCLVECTCLRRYLLCVNIISYSYVYICYYVWRLHCIIKNLVIERMGHKSSPIHSLTNIEQEVVVVERTKYRLLLLNLMFEKKIKWLGLLTIRSVSNQYIILNKHHMLMSLILIRTI